MIDANIDPPLIASQIIDTVGDGLAQLLVREVMRRNLFGLALRLPLSAGIGEVADRLLLFFFLVSTEITGWLRRWKRFT